MAGERTRFAVIPKRSIEVYAEAMGILGRSLGDQVAESLAEDATYRVREALQNAICFMKHSKRRHLTVEDFNRGLKWANVEQIYGHGGMELPHFKTLNHKDSKLQVYYIEDKEVNLRELALDFSLPPDSGDVGIKAQWLVFEGITCPGGKLSKEEISWAMERLDEPYLQFLEATTRAIFGKHKVLRKKAVKSLRESPQIQMLLPNLISFLVIKVKQAEEKSELHLIVEPTLSIVSAIVDNTSLFLTPYVLQLVKLLLFIVLEGHLKPSRWHHKKTAAVILADLCRSHMTFMQQLPHQLLKAFQECYLDPMRPLECLYGSIVGLHHLGAEAVFQVLVPNLKSCLKLVSESLSSKESSNPCDQQSATLVHWALKDAVVSLLKKCASRSSLHAHSIPPHSKLYDLYSEFTEDFGEAIVLSCLHYPSLSNDRGTIQQSRITKMGIANRDSESLRNMIQTYLDGIKSKACDRVHTQLLQFPKPSERLVFSTRTSLGEVHSTVFRKRQFSKISTSEGQFTNFLSDNVPKRSRQKLKTSGDKSSAKAIPGGRQRLLYDISKVSLSLVHPL